VGPKPGFVGSPNFGAGHKPGGLDVLGMVVGVEAPPNLGPGISVPSVQGRNIRSCSCSFLSEAWINDYPE